mmetsp:Transcript_3051/g.4543  ORF Transcript_3051/g.4543 Transcript_3051/m.4543 type:complete len:1552 (+) Transcript_3051:48-4703(+)
MHRGRSNTTPGRSGAAFRSRRRRLDEEKGQSYGIKSRLKQGRLQKRNAKYGWKEYFFVCTNFTLRYHDDEGQVLPNGYISVSDMKEIKCDGRKFDIYTRSRNRIYKLMARSEKEANGWVQALNAAIQYEKACLKNLLRAGRDEHIQMWMINYWDVSTCNSQTRLFGGEIYKAAIGHETIGRKLMLHYCTDEDLLKMLLDILHDPPRRKGDMNFQIQAMLKQFKFCDTKRETTKTRIRNIGRKRELKRSISDSALCKLKREPQIRFNDDGTSFEDFSQNAIGRTVKRGTIRRSSNAKRSEDSKRSLSPKYKGDTPQNPVSPRKLKGKKHRRSLSNYNSYLRVSDTKKTKGRRLKFSKKNYQHTKRELDLSERKAIYDWMLNEHTETLEAISRVLNSLNERVRSLALRFLWLLLVTKNYLSDEPNLGEVGKKFSEIVLSSYEHHRTPSRFLIQNTTTLLQMMMHTNKELSDTKLNLKDEQKKYVVQPYIWQTVFKGLQGSPMFPRKTCLKDINFLLINRPGNLESICQQKDWHTWLLPLLYDIPYEANHASYVAKARVYTFNVYLKILEHSMLTYPVDKFAAEIRRAVISLLSPFTRQSASICQTLLTAFCSLLTTNAQIFDASGGEEVRVWLNALHFIKLVQVIVFMTPAKQFHLGDYTKDLWQKKSMKGNSELKDKTIVLWRQILNHSRNDDGEITKLATERLKKKLKHRTSELDDGKVKLSEKEEFLKVGTALLGSGKQKRKRSHTIGSSFFSFAESFFGSNSREVSISKPDSQVTIPTQRTRAESEWSRGSGNSHRSRSGSHHSREVSRNRAGSVNPFEFGASEERRSSPEKSETAARWINKGKLTRGESILMNSHLAFTFSEAAVRRRKKAVMGLRRTLNKSKKTRQMWLYGSHWKEGIQGDIILLNRLMKFICAVKSRSNRENAEKFSKKILYRLQKRAFQEIPFLCDASAFLSIIRDKYSQISTSMLGQMLKEFVGSSDDSRRKIFKPFEQSRFRSEMRLNRQLDNEILQQNNRRTHKAKILLMGTKNVGKSTIFKQYISHFGRGFSAASRRSFRKDIYENIITSVKNLVWHAERLTKRIKVDSKSLNRVCDWLAFPDDPIDDFQVSVKDVSKMLKDQKRENDIKILETYNLAIKAYLASNVMESRIKGTQKDAVPSTWSGIQKLHDFKSLSPPKIIIKWINEFRHTSFSVAEITRRKLAVIENTVQKCYSENSAIKFNGEIGRAAYYIWKDPAIERVFEGYSSFKEKRINPSVSYLLERAARIGEADMASMDSLIEDVECDISNYTPSIDEVMHVCSESKGAVEGHFEIFSQPIDVVHLAAQRGKRKKYMFFFAGLDAVVFVASLNSYDIEKEEEEGFKIQRTESDTKDEIDPPDYPKYRIHQSLKEFRSLCEDDALKQTAKIIILNKHDLFKEKIARVPITRAFREYEGEPHNSEKVLEFLKTKFVKAAGPLQDIRDIFIHVTTATDHKTMKDVLEKVQKQINSHQQKAIKIVLGDKGSKHMKRMLKRGKSFNGKFKSRFSSKFKKKMVKPSLKRNTRLAATIL